MRRGGASAGSTAEPPRVGLPVGILVWLLAVVYWLTWAPFRRRMGPPEMELALLQDPFVLALNLALLIPIAVVVALYSGGTKSRRVVAGAGAALLVSVFIEAGQLFVEGRNVTAGDVLYNVMGAGLGAFGAVRLSTRLPRRVIAMAVLVVVLAGVSFHTAFSSAALVRGQALEGWEPAFPILAGDEVDVDRRYMGMIREARICAVNAPEPVCLRPGADPEARARLVTAVQNIQALRLSATVLSESDEQVGPARIVTFSGGWDVRNATLAQDGRALTLRVRTPLAGPNGYRIEWLLPDAVDQGRETAVVAMFASGRVTLQAEDGKGDVRRGAFHPGLLQGWRVAAASYPDFLARRLTPHSEPRQVSLHGGRTAAAVAALALFLPVGLVLGTWVGAGPLMAPVIGVATGGALLWILDLVVTGHAPPAFHLAVAGLVTAAGVVLSETWRETVSRRKTVTYLGEPSRSCNGREEFR